VYTVTVTYFVDLRVALDIGKVLSDVGTVLPVKAGCPGFEVGAGAAAGVGVAGQM
jgi:hypothetical protein